MKLTVHRRLDTISGTSSTENIPGESVLTLSSCRPDYKKLSVLKNVFPKVPILAVVSRALPSLPIPFSKSSLISPMAD